MKKFLSILLSGILVSAPVYATTTTDKIAYATSATITCTFASLASSATVGRECTAVDNGTNLYDDAIVTIGVKTSASALANDKAVYIYLAGSEDATPHYDGDDTALALDDTGYTINTNTNLKGPVVINCPTTSTTYYKTFSVAQYFGGVMPRKWGFVVINYTGQALDSTEGNHTKSYTGITYTNS